MKNLISVKLYYDLSIKDIWLFFLWINSCLLAGVHCEIIEVVHPPTFIKTPRPEVYINPEEPLIIPCYAKGKPEPRYYWTLNGERVNWIKPYTSVLSRNLPHSSETTSLPYEVTDPISHFNYSNIPYLPDESGLWYFGVQRLSNDLKPGVYQCVAVNSYGRALSIPMKLEMARLGMFDSLQSKTVHIEPNQTTVLNCSTSKSIPNAKVQWMMKDEDGLQNFVHEDRNHVIDDNGNLYLINLNWINSRTLTYTCVINNPILRTMKTGPQIKLHYSNVFSASKDSLKFKLEVDRPKILFHSTKSQVVLVNESLSIKCIAHGNSLPEIIWEFMQKVNSNMNYQLYRNVKLLPEEYGVRIKNHGTELYISNVKIINRGSYRCRAVSLDSVIPSVDNPQVVFSVDVESKPHFADQPENSVVPENSSIVLRCSVDEEITKPPASITWLVNGEPVERYLDGLRKLSRNNVLFLYNLTVHDSAVFQCVLKNVHGWNIVNAYILVWNQPPAFINVIEGTQYISEGQQVTLFCETFGAPEAKVTWFLNGEDLRSIYSLESDYKLEKGNLVIFRSKLSHSGKYVCKASNIFGTSKSSGKLLVRRQTRIISGPLVEQSFSEKVNQRIKMKYLTEGSTVSLACQAETDPMHELQLKLIWKKDNITLEDAYRLDERFNLSSNGKNVKIVKLKPNDSGVYMCIANTPLDSANSSIHLVIQGRPDPPKYLKLHCDYQSKLAPYIMLTWQIGETNNADIKNVLVTYITGYYRPLEGYSPPEVNPIQPVNTENHQIKEKFKRYTQNDNISNAHYLPWLNESSLETAQMIVKEAILKDQWSSADLVPESEIIEHIKTNNKSLSNIDDGDNNNNNDNNIINLSTLPSGIGRAFIHLNADVIYHFRVQLINHIGKSLPSEIIPSISASVDELCILPPTPTSLNPDYLLVYGNEPNNLIIQWKPLDPVVHNGPGLIYRLTVKCLDCVIGPPKDIHNVTIVKNWSKGKLELTDLITSQVSFTSKKIKKTRWIIETFRTYQVTLQAENYLGSQSLTPLVFTGRSGEDVPQLSPSQLKVLNISSDNIFLSWKLVKEADFPTKVNGAFQGFRVEWCDADLSSDSCEFHKNSQDYILEEPPTWSFPNLRRKSTNSEHILLDKMDNMNSVDLSTGFTSTPDQIQNDENSSIRLEDNMYKAYLNELPGKSKIKIWVRLLNIQYAGPVSDAVIVETKEGVPGRVSEFDVTFIGVNHVEVSWIKPMILNGILISYDLEIYLNNFTENKQTLTKGSQIISSVTIEDPEQCATRISGLKMSTNYTLYIWAKTSAGRGEPNFVNFRTATLSQDFGFIPFKINPIEGQMNAVNLTLITRLPSVLPASLTSTLSYDLDDSEFTTNDNTDSTTTLFKNKPNIDQFNSEINHSVKMSSRRKYQTMFYVQFRQLGSNIWEETQREIHNSWIVLNNLQKDCQYEVRIVRVSESGRSTVSGSKIVHIPFADNLSMNNNWRILLSSKHNRKLLYISLLCGLFLIFSLIGGLLLFVYWFKYKPSSHVIRDIHRPQNTVKRTQLQQQRHHHYHQYEHHVEQYRDLQPQWMLNEGISMQNNDYLTNHMMNTSQINSCNTTTGKYPLGLCVCESNGVRNSSSIGSSIITPLPSNSNNNINDINQSIPLISSTYITDCDPLVNNCITFLKLPHCQSNSSRPPEESLINPDNHNYKYTHNQNLITCNNSNGNNTPTAQQTYAGRLLNRL